MPGVVTSFHQRGAVECSQAGERRNRQMRTFVQAHCPSVVDVLKNGGRTFDDRDFIFHRVTLLRDYTTSVQWNRFRVSLEFPYRTNGLFWLNWHLCKVFFEEIMEWIVWFYNDFK